jgi:Tfp pilus assembly protein PilO
MNAVSTTSKAVYKTMLILIIALVILLICVVGAGWYFILSMSNVVNRYDSEIYTTRAQTTKLAELSWRYQKVFPKRSLVMSAIPSTKDESTFMADMESLAGKNGLVITSSSIGNSLTKAAKTGDFSQTVSKDNYYELPIKYEVSGNYSSVVKFMNELPTLRRLSSVDDVSVTADFSEKTVTGRVKSTFTITIYAKK